MASSDVPFDALDAYAEVVRLYRRADGLEQSDACAAARRTTEGLLSVLRADDDFPLAPLSSSPVTLDGVVPLSDSGAAEALALVFDTDRETAARALGHLNLSGIVLVRDR